MFTTKSCKKKEEKKYEPAYQSKTQKQPSAKFRIPPAEERWYDICPGCGGIFYDPTALRKHWARTHMHEEKFELWYGTCPDCGQIFYDPIELRKHWSGTHALEDYPPVK
jgi:uncharacterized C2H2 Zn-finger protein